uniref:Uncharacterized protein n=1 Tax=Stegastes partitus TaxID=144197 RepID=A0A3B4ZPF0_9TELE
TTASWATGTQVPALSGIHIQDVAVGAEHTLVLSSTGDVYTWGSNSEGQLYLPLQRRDLGHRPGPAQAPAGPQSLHPAHGPVHR